MASVFQGAIEFLDNLGVYDVILPFLLIFSIVFAILEKTKILGTEDIDGKPYTKKNLNSMVAFVAAFIVILSSKLVSAINEIIGKVVLLLVLSISFMLLTGTFFGSGEFTIKSLGKRWETYMAIVMFGAIVVIFLDSLGWLTQFINFISGNYRTDWVASLILVAVVIAFMVGITGKETEEGEKS